ncbi:acetyl-CoA carboxylase biotin carboxyl carrier protein [Emcibacter nanhaiensis]|uniref:Biotin carboxyl carrier protein of acetyl-CoA carboxylase n=1 Tax=Emcibacter nanhaiensis TaxID=1505037 RepID=A0A501PAG5_9PROT|nr:biotin/lipoyl-containing protein [Emcibacter nanhaiensis]TPD57369.1 acetyl-CoA carboxylase biotin carboxyl carrier protein subunit [Emcibacter nanhaiensis]
MSKDFPLSDEDVEEIITILEKSHFEELDIETGRFRLRVSRSGEGWTQEWSGKNDPVVAEQVLEATVEVEEEEGIALIRAPLPGTFYRAPQPGAAPFVEVGSKVEADTVTAILETMKLMNPVHAGVSGEIVEILVENAQPVDADTVLMKVKTA